MKEQEPKKRSWHQYFSSKAQEFIDSDEYAFLQETAYDLLDSTRNNFAEAYEYSKKQAADAYERSKEISSKIALENENYVLNGALSDINKFTHLIDLIQTYEKEKFSLNLGSKVLKDSSITPGIASILSPLANSENLVPSMLRKGLLQKIKKTEPSVLESHPQEVLENSYIKNLLAANGLSKISKEDLRSMYFVLKNIDNADIEGIVNPLATLMDLQIEFEKLPKNLKKKVEIDAISQKAESLIKTQEFKIKELANNFIISLKTEDPLNEKSYHGAKVIKTILDIVCNNDLNLAYNEIGQSKIEFMLANEELINAADNFHSKARLMNANPPEINGLDYASFKLREYKGIIKCFNKHAFLAEIIKHPEKVNDIYNEFFKFQQSQEPNLKKTALVAFDLLQEKKVQKEFLDLVDRQVINEVFALEELQSYRQYQASIANQCEKPEFKQLLSSLIKHKNSKPLLEDILIKEKLQLDESTTHLIKEMLKDDKLIGDVVAAINPQLIEDILPYFKLSKKNGIKTIKAVVEAVETLEDPSLEGVKKLAETASIDSKKEKTTWPDPNPQVAELIRAISGENLSEAIQKNREQLKKSFKTAIDHPNFSILSNVGIEAEDLTNFLINISKNKNSKTAVANFVEKPNAINLAKIIISSPDTLAFTIKHATNYLINIISGNTRKKTKEQASTIKMAKKSAKESSVDNNLQKLLAENNFSKHEFPLFEETENKKHTYLKKGQGKLASSANGKKL